MQQAILIVFLTLFTFTCNKLLYVSTTLRHGARYPLSNNYDIYDSNQTKVYSGILTTVGIRQLYNLGTYMRADYIDRQKIINATLFAKQFQLFSDLTSRCVQSTVAFASGLFPLGTGAYLPENLSQQYLRPPFTSLSQPNIRQIQTQQASQFALHNGFQSIPYTTQPYYFRCSKQMQLVNKRLEAQKSRLSAFQQSQSNYINRLQQILNLKPEYTTLIGLTDVYDLIICDIFLGRKLPDTFTAADYKQIDFIQAYLYTLVYSDILGRTMATPLLNHLLMNMQDVIKRGKDQVKRFTVFSGHDTNIVPLLTVLNLTSADCIQKKWKNQTYTGNCAQVIPFASNIIFQLHQSDNSPGTHYVKVRYNGQFYNLCEKNITQCNYEDFVVRVKRQLVDFQKQCPTTKIYEEQRMNSVNVEEDLYL